MTAPSRFARVALAVLLPFAAACGDDDPVAPVDVMPVSAARLDALAASLEPVSSHPVFEAFFFSIVPRGLPFDEQNFPFAPAPPGQGPARDAMGPGPRLRGQFSTPFRTISIPDSLRGLTFVEERSTILGWRRDTLPDGRPRPGAPANGIRFVLIDALAFESTAPLGYMDVTQSGPATAPLLRVDVYDTTGTNVQHFGGALSTSSLAGWTARGAARIDEATTRGRNGTTTIWSGSGGVTIPAQRGESFGSGGTFVTTHRLTVDGTELRLQAVDGLTIDAASTFTVLVGGAPFARRVDGGGTGTWQHLASDRPLNAGELAQVDAFIGVLRALPNAEGAFQEAITNLMGLQRIFAPIEPIR